MGCRILYDIGDGTAMACFYDSVTDTAFGPVVYDHEGIDAREILERAHEMLATGLFEPREDEWDNAIMRRSDPRLLNDAGLNRLKSAAIESLLNPEVVEDE